jgi:hypothetical protein
MHSSLDQVAPGGPIVQQSASELAFFVGEWRGALGEHVRTFMRMMLADCTNARDR